MSIKFVGSRARQIDENETTAFRQTPYITSFRRPVTTSKFGKAAFTPLSTRPTTGAHLTFGTDTGDSTFDGVEGWATSQQWAATTGGKRGNWDGQQSGTAKQEPMSARGTRKEELEYLEVILGKAQRHKSLNLTQMLTARSKEEGEENNEQDQKSEGSKGGNRRGKNRLKALAEPKPKHKPLNFGRYAPLYDVASRSEFPSSQNFAAKGVAALCSIPGDRDNLYNTGAVQYMLDLLLDGRSKEAKVDACDALVELLKSDEACRNFLQWTGRDPKDGTIYTSGLHAAFKLKDSRNIKLQQTGAIVIGNVLMSNALKHTERISPEYLEGLCAYGLARDETAARRAGKTLVNVINAVLDTGIRWSEAHVLPIIQLLRNPNLHPKVRFLVLRAFAQLSKEGDRACTLLSKVGCMKTLSLQLAAKGHHPVNDEDVNYIRVITQICEVDSQRFEDVVLIGAVGRIILVLRKNLVAQSVLLPTEVEVQRRCIRFLEKMAAKANIRYATFQAGTGLLCLDVLDMERSSCKSGAVNTLTLLLEDPEVQSNFQDVGSDGIPRLAAHVRSTDKSLRPKALDMLRQLCSKVENVRVMTTLTDLMDAVVLLMEDAIKMNERAVQLPILSTAVNFLLTLAQHSIGKRHIDLWNIVARLDPNMRKVRGLFTHHRDKELLWKPYDNFLAIMTAIDDEPLS